MEDYIFGNDPSDYIHMSEDLNMVEGQEKNTELHETKMNKNFIETDIIDDGNLPESIVNHFICQPIIKASSVHSSDIKEDSSLFDDSDNSMQSLKGQCWNCKSVGPLGLYCNTCEGTVFIFESILSESSSECNGGLEIGEDTCLESVNKATQHNGQLIFHEIMMQLYTLIKSYWYKEDKDQHVLTPVIRTTLITQEDLGDLRQSKNFDLIRVNLSTIPPTPFCNQGPRHQISLGWWFQL